MGPLGFPRGVGAWFLHPVGLMGHLHDGCNCGGCSQITFVKRRWTRRRKNHPDQTYYGPLYDGTKKLDKFDGWDELIAEGKATDDEKAIVIAMASNEGAMDAVQAWDWQTLSAGAMQKTVTPEGFGELPKQIFEFKSEHPHLYYQLFSQCGWTVVQEGKEFRIYYSSQDTGNNKITGTELYELIKKDFSPSSSSNPKPSRPLAAIAHAIIHFEFQKKQVEDFIKRMREALNKRPSGYNRPAKDFFESKLGRALVLDHDVNSPGTVRSSLKMAIDKLRERHPDLNADPIHWGASRDQYEAELIELYGPSRKMVSAEIRYTHLKGTLEN